MGLLLPFPPHWTLPGHEGVFGTWGTAPKLAPPAVALANASTSCHPRPPQGEHGWCGCAGVWLQGRALPMYLLPTREIKLTLIWSRQELGKGLPQRDRKMAVTQPRGVTGGP